MSSGIELIILLVLCLYILLLSGYYFYDKNNTNNKIKQIIVNVRSASQDKQKIRDSIKNYNIKILDVSQNIGSNNLINSQGSNNLINLQGSSVSY